MSGSVSVDEFVGLSAALTGFSAEELQGTGLCESHYRDVAKIIGGRIFGRLLLTWQQVTVECGSENEAALNRKLKSAILESPLMGPVARNLVTLWYTGNWNQLPRDWRDTYGATADDSTRVMSAEAYREGLIWRAIGGHPPAAKSTGFGSWSFPVPGAEPLQAVAQEQRSHPKAAKRTRRK
ncbi:MAG: hypothetical protein KDA85_00330 [Planctomycetaceae bacterium]|nr:hypothetical protein [Planctomycetaceae bacterium]